MVEAILIIIIINCIYIALFIDSKSLYKGGRFYNSGTGIYLFFI